MKAVAEEDYRLIINQVASGHDDSDMRNWVKNMQLNEYLVNYLLNLYYLLLVISPYTLQLLMNIGDG